jgi:predicted DCC family thiol-disulfide oxidoreductase YuxK
MTYRGDAMSERQAVILYDEDCGFCKWSLDKIVAWDRARRLRPIAIQSEAGGSLLAAVAPAARLDSWHLISEGELLSGGAAVAPLLRMLPGGRPLAAVLGAFPTQTDRAYRYIARHRARWARLLRIDTK